ncbi:TetR/AcrR family transcriptional regulator [Rhodococcus fascians]|uniref:TetR/AcrR family transcriptional regulator n=1 Tax=Rhodococcoides fascians TaxID=1828 RepID=UPI00068E1DCA|nr:TetR/AcrR family transcriptional regulator [Rhodococcus fascians]MBY4383843.1 TetR/AcrR family transcriptional regulator [Rhodococcus fascians]MBY4399054.1 TetR/AcrR family transcriptional regulator [Rhodococcus fascians]MBY4408592.1 TetR/AcrR family transcriptional regulator [Rhodococcus fascians]MBY4423631.1 TetR/AcrR family transcriptional regulator [Rhodococcus fascians]MBY4462845.1 TetR/AcrR family transcriptional regulator [Rhodococcus fascians]
MIEENATTHPPDQRSDSRRNRVRLVDAARILVAEKGIEVSAAEIAARAEVGVATLYRRFGSKDALIRDILIDGISEVEAVADEALADTDPWRGFCTFFTFFSHTQDVNQGIAEYLATAAAIPSSEQSEYNGRLLSKLKRIVKRAHETGCLRNEVTWRDVVILSRASVGAGQCLGVYAAPDQAHRSCAVIIEGMRADPKS